MFKIARRRRWPLSLISFGFFTHIYIHNEFTWKQGKSDMMSRRGTGLFLHFFPTSKSSLVKFSAGASFQTASRSEHPPYDGFRSIFTIATIRKHHSPHQQASIFNFQNFGRWSNLKKLPPLLCRPSPQLEQVTASYEHQYTSPQLQQRPYRQHFIDLTTGFRLRYLEWPFAGNDVIVLLHGMAQQLKT